jgi:hypothetical protein
MASEQQKAAGGPVILRDRYVIQFGSPLPELSTPTAEAYLAEDQRGPARALFALIVRPGFPARIDIMKAMKGNECPGLMTLVEWGAVDWPPAKRKVMAVVYERPMGGRVATSLGDFKRLDEFEAVRKLITPAVAALKDLRGRNITHRAIRLSNMFWANPERDRIVLGDCATAPPGMDQPVLLEPLESAMALPAGRGPGTPADDAYALGASLALLLLGRNPVASYDDEHIIRQKIQFGSYAVLIGEERLPLAMVEVLRGLLCDDGHERWGYDALDLWLSGRRLTPLLAKIEKRAARGFTFNNRDYYLARDLAVAMAKNWAAGLAALSDGSLELWLRRSLDNKEKANAVEVAMALAVGASDRRSGGDVLLAKVCMILDPYAPIRYKTLAFMPDGFGWLLAVTMASGGDVRTLAEAIMREVPHAWMETREAYNPDNSMMDTMYRGQKAILDRGGVGEGIERVLYQLMEPMPCLSPLVAEEHVVELRDLLPALNVAARKAEAKGMPMDRHIAAFVAARASFDIDGHMSDLAARAPEQSARGILNLLGVIQWRLGQTGLVDLANWVSNGLRPLIDSFRSRPKRRELERDVPGLARAGSLVDMARLLDNPTQRHADTAGFQQARYDWALAQRELEDIQAGRLNNRDEAVATARQVASLISVGICFITIVLLVLSRLV